MKMEALVLTSDILDDFVEILRFKLHNVGCMLMRCKEMEDWGSLLCTASKVAEDGYIFNQDFAVRTDEILHYHASMDFITDTIVKRIDDEYNLRGIR